MQKILLAGVAAAGLLSGPALASDFPTKAPVYKTPIAAPPYNWSGLYVGANFGGGWSNGSLTIPGNNLYGGLTEFIGGVQAGYNFQAGHLLFGVEGDLLSDEQRWALVEYLKSIPETPGRVTPFGGPPETQLPQK